MFRTSRLSKIHFSILLFYALFIFSPGRGLSQEIRIPVKGPVPDVVDSVSIHYTRLVKEFSENKQMPAGLEKQIIYALSYFPELAKTKIKFRLKKSKGGIIATRPTIGSLLRRSSQRTYIVIINDSTKGRRIPLFANCDANGQVGILGHELCHIVYFSNSTGLALLGLGISHVSKSYMDRFEHNTDSLNIVRGLGYQLIAWNEYLHKGFRAMRANDAPSPEKFAAGKRYMSIEEIRQQMANTNYP